VKNDWLTTSSFERAFNVVSAINIVSIHAKLTKAGMKNPIDNAEIKNAQVKIIDFLDTLQSLMNDTEKNQNGIVVGADPRLGELALFYMAERRRFPPRSQLYTISITEFEKIIQSNNKKDMDTLVSCLESLRSIVEQYAQTDIAGMFGDE
jgi:hypothetical protein